jgi:hypothetical protein
MKMTGFQTLLTTAQSANMSFIPSSKAFSDITSKNGINFLKLRAGWETSAGFATGYPVANTIDGVAIGISLILMV